MSDGGDEAIIRLRSPGGRASADDEAITDKESLLKSWEKPASAKATMQPTLCKVMGGKPASAEATDKPASAEATDKPAFAEATDKPAFAEATAGKKKMPQRMLRHFN